MATKRRAGLGRGLGALIPQAPESDDRAIDVFFNGSAPSGRHETSKNTVAETQNVENDSPEQTSDPVEVPTKAKTKAKAKATVERLTELDSDDSIRVNESTGEIIDDAGETSGAATSRNSSTDVSTGLSTGLSTDSSTSSATGESNTAASNDVDIEQAENLLPVPGAQLGNLDPYRVVANNRQPRTDFDQDALDELTHSVREFGVFQPIVVRPIPDGDPRRAEGEYELIMGERRLRATKASGRASIPAIIRHTDDDDMLRDALLENLHRAELNPLEEASAYQQLLDDFGCSQQELSERIGRSRPRISNTIRLLKLPVDVQRKVAAGVLSAGHARAVLSVGEPAAMTQLANKIVNENLTVREAELAAATMSIRTDKPSTKPAQVGSDSLNSHLTSVGERLGDRLNTRVKVVLRKTKGQISIDFASVADLNRILEAIGEPTDV